MKSIKNIKKMLIGMIALPIMVLTTTTAIGQDALETSAGADIVSKYVWRGVDQGTGASIQPSLGLSYKGLSLGAWGSVSFANPLPYELDFSLGYSVGGFSIGITDYYWNGIEGSFFAYHADNHLFEGNLSFSFGEKFPLTLSWNTFFAGRMDQDEEGKQQYSTYIEAAYDFSLGGLDFSAAIGAAPWDSPVWLAPANGKTGFRISSISLTGSKKLDITPTFSVPLFVQCIFSPATDASHLVVGFSF
jgi:hypothetical protein